MIVRPLLFVMNPRRIVRCMDAIHALEIDKVFFKGYTESQLEPVIARAVEDARDYSHILLLADDTVPTQRALDLVVAQLDKHPVVTGYCNLDLTGGKDQVNITSRPFRDLFESRGEDYAWRTLAEAENWPDAVIPTWFGGATLTAMTRELWQKYPFRVIPGSGSGYASDWTLACRLQCDGVPMVAARGALVQHVKHDWTKWGDGGDPEKRLLIGEIPAEVRWDMQWERQFDARVAPSATLRSA